MVVVGVGVAVGIGATLTVGAGSALAVGLCHFIIAFVAEWYFLWIFSCSAQSERKRSGETGAGRR